MMRVGIVAARLRIGDCGISNVLQQPVSRTGVRGGVGADTVVLRPRQMPVAQTSRTQSDLGSRCPENVSPGNNISVSKPR